MCHISYILSMEEPSTKVLCKLVARVRESSSSRHSFRGRKGVPEGLSGRNKMKHFFTLWTRRESCSVVHEVLDVADVDGFRLAQSLPRQPGTWCGLNPSWNRSNHQFETTSLATFKRRWRNQAHGRYQRYTASSKDDFSLASGNVGRAVNSSTTVDIPRLGWWRTFVDSAGALKLGVLHRLLCALFVPSSAARGIERANHQGACKLQPSRIVAADRLALALLLLLLLLRFIKPLSSLKPPASALIAL